MSEQEYDIHKEDLLSLSEIDAMIAKIESNLSPEDPDIYKIFDLMCESDWPDNPKAWPKAELAELCHQIREQACAKLTKERDELKVQIAELETRLSAGRRTIVELKIEHHARVAELETELKATLDSAQTVALFIADSHESNLCGYCMATFDGENKGQQVLDHVKSCKRNPLVIRISELETALTQAVSHISELEARIFSNEDGADCITQLTKAEADKCRLVTEQSEHIIHLEVGLAQADTDCRVIRRENAGLLRDIKKATEQLVQAEADPSGPWVHYSDVSPIELEIVSLREENERLYTALYGEIESQLRANSLYALMAPDLMDKMVRARIDAIRKRNGGL